MRGKQKMQSSNRMQLRRKRLIFLRPFGLQTVFQKNLTVIGSHKIAALIASRRKAYFEGTV
jgi:hypothetical protein